MYFVYVIKNIKTGQYYKGQTNNLERRLFEHESDRWYPFELIFVQICDNRSESMNIERYLKTGQGRKFIEIIFD